MTPKVTITRKDIINNLEKYLEANKSKSPKEQSKAYRELDELCKQYNLTAEEVLEQIIGDNK